MLWWERVSPSEVGKGGFASIMRLSGALSLTAGFLLFYSRSISAWDPRISSMKRAMTAWLI